MEIIWRLTGFVLLLGLCLLATMTGGRLAFFIDFPSIVLVGGVVTFGLVASFGPVESFMAFVAGMTVSSRGFFGHDDLPRHIAVMDRAIQLTWAAGFLGLLVGMILMLQNMDDPSMIGPGMAVSLLSMVYAVALAELLFAPLKQGLENQWRLHREEKDTTEPGKVSPSSLNIARGVAVTMTLVAMFFVLLIAMN